MQVLCCMRSVAGQFNPTCRDSAGLLNWQEIADVWSETRITMQSVPCSPCQVAWPAPPQVQLLTRQAHRLVSSFSAAVTASALLQSRFRCRQQPLPAWHEQVVREAPSAKTECIMRKVLEKA